MRILVRPCYADFLENRLFEPRHRCAASWMLPVIRLRELCLSRGWQIDTWDMAPLETADVVLFQDLPREKRDVIEARRKAPRARFVLLLWESPLNRPWFFVKQNHAEFDAIMTYNHQLCDEKRYFRYFLPIGTPVEEIPNLPFAERRPLVLINSNSYPGILSQRQPGLAGLPFFGPMMSSWKVPLNVLMSQNRGQLYSRRRRIARLAERAFPEVLDVFGPGWRGEKMSWIHRWIRNRPFANAKGGVTAKFTVLPKYRFCLSFENCERDEGYISEKIFDALLSGTVPIYLGDARIAEHVPEDAFVDARKFRSDSELLAFARDCGESQWQDLRAAGQAFIQGPGMKKFSSHGYAERAIEVLERVKPSGGV